MKKEVVNIINFIRGCEPREEKDLLTPVKEQIKLMESLNLKGTFLIQYDALIKKEFTEVLLKLPKTYEVGVWLEFGKPLTDAMNIPWKGRYDWDWHAHCDMTVGYGKAERELAIDVIFARFKEIFGYFPRVLGAWAFDAHTLEYANDKYGLDAACNCKEQWGTDGYNLWGGYYGQGYYPSKNNSFCPAETKGAQIDVPVFRMLGSDPIEQYDAGLNIKNGLGKQSVITLEPCYKHGGGSEKWVDWYVKENFNGKCLSFGYTQAGQENSFGWEGMREGLNYQFKLFADMQKDGKLCVETLGETGINYKATYELTPPSAITAEKKAFLNDKKSAWYSSNSYRINLFCKRHDFWIRDIYLFDEGYKERYLDDVCRGKELFYDNLPVMDGARLTGDGIRGGIYPYYNGKRLKFRRAEWKEIDDKTAQVSFFGTSAGTVVFTLSEKSITVTSDSEIELRAEFSRRKAAELFEFGKATESGFEFSYNGFKYGVAVKAAGKGEYFIKGKKIEIYLKK